MLGKRPQTQSRAPRLRDIAALLAVLSACAPEPTPDLRVTFEGQPARERAGDLRFIVFATPEDRPCEELERLAVAQPSAPDVRLTAVHEESGTQWPESIQLQPLSPGGRVFGVVLLSSFPHATVCSQPIAPDAREIAVQVHLLGTQQGPPMHARRARFSAIPLDGGRVLAVGGNAAGTTVEVFEPTTQEWRLISPLNLMRWLHASSALLDGRVLVTGGVAPSSNSVAMPRVELVDPVSGEAALINSMEAARCMHAATRLPGGEVLITGGWSRTVTHASAEVFQPDAGTWRLVGVMTEARRQHTSTLLADGTVLIVGGVGETGPLSSTELYDPRSQTFTPGPALQSPRERHVAVLLADGTVLIAGGGGASTERYLPETRTFVPAGLLDLPEPDPCATLLPSGQVALSGLSQVVQFFEPAQGTWSARAVLSVPRGRCEAWPTPDGGIMFAGGNDSNHHLSTEVVPP